MASSLNHPAALALLTLPLIAYVVWRWQPPPVGRRRAHVVLGVRVVLLTLVVGAVAGLQVRRVPAGQSVVVAADRSASPEAAVTGERDSVRRLAASLGPDDSLGVVSFARDAVIEAPLAAHPAFSDFATAPNPNFTDIEAALRLAASVMPDGGRRHVVLMSDGRQNIGDAVAQARLLASQGLRVDVVPLNVSAGPEVRIDSVQAPATAAAGSRLHVRVVITSNVATSGRLHLSEDNATVEDRTLQIVVGETVADVILPPAQPGFHRVHALIDPVADTFVENNVGDALIEVLGTQHVLVVEGTPGAGVNVVGALRSAGLDVSVVTPDGAPRTAVGLAGVAAAVLDDVPAAALGSERMNAIAGAVRDLGMGLAVFGGAESFGPGGYAGTPLETALPLQMDISNRDQKPPVAVVLVVETVESPVGDAIVRGAVRSVVEHLTSRDYVGVTDASASGLVVPLTRLSDRTAVENQINAIPGFGDTPSYEPDLTAARDALASHAETTRHVIILGDGDAMSTSPALIDSMVKAGITITAVGVDVHGQPQLMAAMRDIATKGHGRFYQSEDPSQVPDILLDETDHNIKPWIVEGAFRPTLVSPSATLSGVDVSAFPQLGGYVASTPKSAAEVVLRSPQRDPVLAQWQYGLGRVAAWTSDTQGRWSRDLLAWPQAGRLLAGIVGSTLPLAADPAVELQTSLEGDRAHLLASVAQAPDDAAVVAGVITPTGQGLDVALASTAPGRFEGDMPADTVGDYLLHLGVTSHGRVIHAVTSGLAVAYSPEFRYLGTDMTYLREIARAGGGDVLADLDAAAGVAVPERAVPVDLAAWLLAAAILLLPLDVALRRLALRPGDAAVWTALAQRRRSAPEQVPPEPTLARLRDRLERHRERTPAAGGGAAPPPPDDLAARLLERRRGAGSTTPSTDEREPPRRTGDHRD